MPAPDEYTSDPMAASRGLDLKMSARSTLELMPSGTFNLVRELMKLQRAIPGFRRKLKASRPLARKFRATRALYDAAVEKLNKIQQTPLPSDGAALEAERARRERLSSWIERLTKKVLAIRWQRFTASTDFIRTFVEQLGLVLQRLPLTLRWSQFVKEVRKLRLMQLGSWAESLPEQDLETLEVRLKEMVDLARATAKTTLGSNIDRLRKECGWTFDQLAAETQLAKTLILGHVNKGKRARPFTLKLYAEAFSRRLHHPITVANLETPLQE